MNKNSLLVMIERQKHDGAVLTGDSAGRGCPYHGSLLLDHCLEIQ